MAEIDAELVERVTRWCAEAGRQTGRAEIHAALALALGSDVRGRAAREIRKRVRSERPCGRRIGEQGPERELSLIHI